MSGPFGVHILQVFEQFDGVVDGFGQSDPVLVVVQLVDVTSNSSLFAIRHDRLTGDLR